MSESSKNSKAGPDASVGAGKIIIKGARTHPSTTTLRVGYGAGNPKNYGR